MNPQTSTRTRHLLSLLVLIAGLLGLAVPATAQTNYTSDEINNAILLPGSIVPEWTQPEVPWQIEGSHIYSYKDDYHWSDYTLGNLRFNYTSEKPTVIVYYTSSGHYLNITDTDNRLRTNRYYNMLVMPAGNVDLNFRSYGSNDPNYYISSFGIYELTDQINASIVTTPKSKPIEIINDSANPWYVSGDGELCSSRTSIGNANSEVKLKFTIDKITKLSWEQRYISRNNGRNNQQHLEIYTDKDSDLFNWYDQIDDSTWSNTLYEGYWYKHAEVFMPGTYEITFRELQYDYDSGCKQALIRNIELNDEWFEVTTVAGDLGNSVIDEISRYGYSELNDVELLKVNGKLNAADWARISQMTNLMGLDIEETDVTMIPASQFKDNSMLSYINLPKGLKVVGDQAFSGSNLKYLNLPEGLECIEGAGFYANRFRKVHIPASVKEIKSDAFHNSWVRDLTFAQNANLKLGVRAFYTCTALKNVELPDTVTFGTEIGYFNQQNENSHFGGYNNTSGLQVSFAFGECYALEYIKFPSNLKVIPAGICTYDRGLKTVILPDSLKRIELGAFLRSGLTNIDFPNSLEYIGQAAFLRHSVPEELYSLNFPESLKSIDTYAFYNGNITEVRLPLHLNILGRSAFENNPNLKTLRMHSGAKDLPQFLSGCDALETIVLPCATPPTRTADILGSQDKKKINLIVPDFARSSYALDDYWYLFGSITSGEEADVQDYWNVTGNLVLREGRRMQGTPEVEVSNGGSVTVVGETPATFGDLTFNFNESAPAAFVNSCPNTTAGSIQVRFTVNANRWYMFTPMFDVNLADITVTNTDNYVFRYYDAARRAEGNVNTTVGQASANWKNVTDTQLKAGVGYIFQCDTDSEIIFPEASVADSRVLSTTQSDLSLEAHESESIANADWNLIGNPYPAYFDIWYLDVDAPITVYSRNSSYSNRVEYRALSVTDDNYVLRPMEAFFIQKPTENAQAIFQIDGRQATQTIGNHSAQNAPARHAAAKKAERNLFNIQLSDKEGIELDRTRVVINEAASMDYEIRCDAAKFMSTGAQLYTIDPEGIQMAINERPLADGEVALGVTTGEDRQYSIEASRADGDVWLIDLKTGAEHDLTAAPYTLFADPNSTIEGRYALRFRPAETGVDGAIAAKARVEAGIGYISIENPKEEAVTVYGLDGSETFRTSDATARIDMAAGIYLVRLGSKTHKVIVK